MGANRHNLCYVMLFILKNQLWDTRWGGLIPIESPIPITWNQILIFGLLFCSLQIMTQIQISFFVFFEMKLCAFYES